MTVTRGMRRIVAGLGLALVCPGLAFSAPAFLYDCDMDGTEYGRGWLSPKIAIVLPEEGGATIVDAMTLTFLKGPVAGTILRDNDSRFIVKWTLENVRADSGRSFAHFDYRASISKTTGKIDLTAGPRTFDSGLRSQGTCARRTH
ncbi:hypothetical protein OS190_14445 [Sulfitobacter sp. F26204]|uniref:hypothetical protein n=1 Tax=Sulfitobacter sp. F26204 TaxID=2996014 RepID=UPI00225E5705|nr:hypothetical protein [Sulfitobacter sp. F26204]MCX7560773.1 hypothetical protein [Sulfitobacter sp. F26204]